MKYDEYDQQLSLAGLPTALVMCRVEGIDSASDKLIAGPRLVT